MKHILLIILSLFVYQSYGADIEVPIKKPELDIRVCEGRYSIANLIVQETDTIRQVIDKLYDSRKSCNRIEIKPIKGIWSEGTKKFSVLEMDQTVSSCDLLASDSVDVIFMDLSTPTIRIKCMTLNGRSFEIDWPLFTSTGTLGSKIIEKGLLKVETGWRLKFIHRRAGELKPYIICADQVAGLLEDPNLTVVIEPRR